MALAVLSGLASAATLLMFAWFLASDPVNFLERFWGRVSWGRVRIGVEKLCDVLKSSSWRPTAVLAVDGGGAIVAGLLCANIPWKPSDYLLGIAQVHYSLRDGAREAKVTMLPENWPPNQSILVIDSELYTGQTMQAVVTRVLNELRPAEVKTMVLFGRQPSTLAPDYLAFSVGKVVAMPWEWWPWTYRLMHRRSIWASPKPL